MLGISLGPWRSMSIFILNVPFAIEKRIPFPLSPAKSIGDYFAIRRCGSNMLFLIIMRLFICAPNVRSVKRGAARTRKKSVRSNMVHNWSSEFVPHRHLRRRQVLIFITREYIDAPKFCAYRLLIK
jgi:hypothetical protein